MLRLNLFFVISTEIPLEYPSSCFLEHRKLVVEERDVQLQLFVEVSELAHQLRVDFALTYGLVNTSDSLPQRLHSSRIEYLPNFPASNSSLDQMEPPYG